MISAEQHNENTGSVTVHCSLPTVPCGASWRNEKVMYPLSRGFHVRTRVLSKDQRKAQQRHSVKLQYMYQQRNLTLSRKFTRSNNSTHVHLGVKKTGFSVRQIEGHRPCVSQIVRFYWPPQSCPSIMPTQRIMHAHCAFCSWSGAECFSSLGPLVQLSSISTIF